jgi:hypothetical protein
MATSEKQVQANLKNSKLSTGPTSELGKKVAAANSAKRGGISGEGKSLSPEMWERVAATKYVLAQGNKPVDQYDHWLIEQAAVASVLMTECDDQLIGLTEGQADLACAGWHTQKEIEAGDLAQYLGRHPYRTSRKLRQSPEGCRYLIDLWRCVQALLLKAGELTPELHQRILDLLGIAPELRAAGLTELDAPTDDTTAPVCRAQAIIERELASLHTLLDSPELQAVSEKARLRTIEGTEPWKSREAGLIIRYRAAHARKFHWCMTELKRRRNERARQGRAVGSLPRSEVPRSPATPPPSSSPPPSSTASVPPVSRPAPSPAPVPAGRPLNRRQRRALEREEREQEQRDRWSSRHSP